MCSCMYHSFGLVSGGRGVAGCPVLFWKNLGFQIINACRLKRKVV